MITLYKIIKIFSFGLTFKQSKFIRKIQVLTIWTCSEIKWSFENLLHRQTGISELGNISCKNMHLYRGIPCNCKRSPVHSRQNPKKNKHLNIGLNFAQLQFPLKNTRRYQKVSVYEILQKLHGIFPWSGLKRVWGFLTLLLPTKKLKIFL